MGVHSNDNGGQCNAESKEGAFHRCVTKLLNIGVFTMKSDDMCTDPQLTPCAKSLRID